LKLSDLSELQVNFGGRDVSFVDFWRTGLPEYSNCARMLASKSRERIVEE
jgi:hypothetical protein